MQFVICLVNLFITVYQDDRKTKNNQFNSVIRRDYR